MDPRGATIRHVRQARWRSESDREIRYEDWQIRWDDVVGVDFVVVPFQQIPLLAHTMLSFRLSDGRALGLSVEARLESDEHYAAVAGAARQFELIYVLADEPDLFGLRAVARGDDVYLYESRATPEQAAELLRVVLRRANQLKRQPEFYDSLVNNCTTNLVDLLAEVGNLSADALEVARLPGQSTGRWAYEMGLLRAEAPFPEVRRRAWISDQIRRYRQAPDFSRRIRQSRLSGARPAPESGRVMEVNWHAAAPR
jgi:hypothetical protein